MIKAQKKGTMQIAHLPLAMVETYDVRLELFAEFPKKNHHAEVPQNLLKSLTTLFPPPEGTGRDISMSTFEGDLISSPEEYIAVLKPGLHIIFNYPPTVEEISMSFGALWATDAPRTSYTPNPSDPTPMESDIMNTYLTSASPTLIPSANLKKYELQPPEIHFHVPAPTPISITLFNASFPAAYFHSPNDPEDVPLAGPSAPKAFRYTPEKSRGSASAPDITPTGEDAYAPLPPWSPFSLYKNPNSSDGSTDPPNQHVWEPRPDGECKIFTGGTFATTSFDVFAQTERQRVICALSWEVEVSPDGKIKDLVSEEEMQALSWRSTDDQLAPPPVTMQRRKTSEKRAYANYAEPFPGGNSRWGEKEEDVREIGRDGWWMVAPRRLPLSFSGRQEGERTFIVGSVEEGIELLQAFMTRCGVGEDIIKVSYTFPPCFPTNHSAYNSLTELVLHSSLGPQTYLQPPLPPHALNACKPHALDGALHVPNPPEIPVAQIPLSPRTPHPPAARRNARTAPHSPHIPHLPRRRCSRAGGRGHCPERGLRDRGREGPRWDGVLRRRVELRASGV